MEHCQLPRNTHALSPSDNHYPDFMVLNSLAFLHTFTTLLCILKKYSSTLHLFGFYINGVIEYVFCEV